MSPPTSFTCKMIFVSSRPLSMYFHVNFRFGLSIFAQKREEAAAIVIEIVSVDSLLEHKHLPKLSLSTYEHELSFHLPRSS